MSEPEASPQMPDSPATPNTPMAPKPVALIACGMVAILAGINILDGGEPYVTLALVVLFGLILGVDVSRFIKGGGQ